MSFSVPGGCLASCVSFSSLAMTRVSLLFDRAAVAAAKEGSL